MALELSHEANRDNCVSFIAVVMLLVIGLSFLLDANRFKTELESELSKVLERHVSVGELKFSILSGSVSAGDLAISEVVTGPTSLGSFVGVAVASGKGAQTRAARRQRSPAKRRQR